ncbi:MAG TPA: hypothetical protein VLM37_06835, partial [Fibrobacteraceae bacterium]|nr:hypothetical protein [Fibrobacteraceae bacterium]
SINGESKGTTPSKVSLLGTRSAVLTLSKEGYYTKCRILKPKPGNTLDVGELLTEKKDIETPSTKFKLKCLEVSRKKDPAAVKDLRSALQDQIDRWPKESKALIEKQMALYPPNPSQGSDEGVEDYQTRTDAWEKDRDAEEERQQGVADQCAHDLDSLVELLDQDQDATAASPMLYSFSESSSSMSSSSEYEEDRSSESEVGSDEYDSSEDTAESNYVERDTDDSYAEDSDARDEAVDDAVNDMDARFGRGDEYRKWGAWALVATAVGSGVVAVLQHMKYSDAKTDYDDAKENLDDLHDNIDSACSQNFPSNYDYCVEALTASETVQQYQEVVDHNKSVMNSYASGRNVFLVFTAASVAGSVILFTW